MESPTLRDMSLSVKTATNGAMELNDPTESPGDNQPQVKGMEVVEQDRVEGDFHRFCAEGKLDEVKAVLSTGFYGLETLGRSGQSSQHRLP